MTRPWDFADAWVLAAIGGYRRPCTLADLIAAADMINHAILLETELEDALGRLTGAGLVRVFEDWTFEVTDDGATVTSSETRDLQAHLRMLQARLDDFEPGTTRVKLSRGLMAAAVEEYQSR